MPKGVKAQDYKVLVKLVTQILDKYETNLTIRQIYYRLISPSYQYFPRTGSMYNSYENKMVTAIEKQDIDWRRITDYSRRVIDTPITYTGPYNFPDELNKEVPQIVARYTEDLWEMQGLYLRIFCEKSALADLVAEVSLKYQVGLSVGGGYSSFTRVMNEVDRIEKKYMDRGIVILYLGDWDPTGLDIREGLQKRLKTYGNSTFKFDNVALNEKELAVLPANPTKKVGPRYDKYHELHGDRTWELDALPPNILQTRVENAILKYIDADI